MTTNAGILGRATFAALTAAALGLGAASAFAAPAAPRETRRVCDPYICERYCLRTYGSGTTGYCTLADQCRCIRP